ncbi:DUF1259 domain-containing protein [Aneurinibacillus aneurinilyticus]|jgi:hypothetical protein|uniref:DUF1259 domain-containing protein n=2 Tax=Aneurinibacillus aneurinilyticus TaxID=1391 RepID=A0A848D1D3_ANEAE|nr:DUF1259 domain-containing protein [Aneurinibacillus aneurinilyticus]ERI10941.1 hypothetical protein HMPREF0083_00966 [Aneurinibacillus aneurinilyticus ATCC 12856]MED0673338.1 DUF1259 domain-containing protein [Aneurinibacillus aneurinilyticus]MED0707710.1 DUF1259 domain-containing protein [Aneurinibacillus aneurinilyticus]MED0721933.1 DUF1259 domain-containing protein [Aneurinibacillus aneurinilyticus]MED0742956.1 DUF1259 domain-containing protein [Aneurinibacillus aneurinilyticus]
MPITKQLCNRLARILGGTGMHEKNRCDVTKKRNLRVTMLGKRYEVEQEFVFESMDKRGRTLNTGEITVLQKEVNRFVGALRRRGIRVTAIHNHWLFEKPRLMYVHYEFVERPVIAARKIKEALREAGIN